MKITVTHKLTLRLGTPARAVEHLLLTPQQTPQQKVERWSIEMPGLKDAAQFRDAFGNKAHLVSQVKPEEDIVIEVSGVVETLDKAGVIGRLDRDPMAALFRRPTELTKPDAALAEGLGEMKGRIALLHELMDRVAPKDQSQMQVGMSQSQSGDSASVADRVHRFIATARSLDIPARYVTGYVLGDEDFPSGFHAWAEAWDEGLGWVGFDPTLNICPVDRHVRLASGLDAMGTVPVRAVPVWAEMPDEVVTVEAD